MTLYIISEIYNASIENRDISTWELAKGFFNGEMEDFSTKKDKLKFLSDKSALVRSRLLAMSKKGLIEMKKNSDGVYEFILDGNKIRKNKFKFPNKTKMGVAIRVNGLWSIFELDE